MSDSLEIAACNGLTLDEILPDAAILISTMTRLSHYRTDYHRLTPIIIKRASALSSASRRYTVEASTSICLRYGGIAAADTSAAGGDDGRRQDALIMLRRIKRSFLFIGRDARAIRYCQADDIRVTAGDDMIMACCRLPTLTALITSRLYEVSRVT